jgi:hypothetical protein
VTIRIRNEQYEVKLDDLSSWTIKLGLIVHHPKIEDKSPLSGPYPSNTKPYLHLKYELFAQIESKTKQNEIIPMLASGALTKINQGFSSSPSSAAPLSKYFNVILSFVLKLCMFSILSLAKPVNWVWSEGEERK